jgi:hypothetical protein
MTQKQSMFKGKSKKKSVPPSRHGKAAHIRKGMLRTDGDGSTSSFGSSSVTLSHACRIDVFSIGCAGKRVVKPKKFTEEMDAEKVRSKVSCCLTQHDWFGFVALARCSGTGC